MTAEKITIGAGTEYPLKGMLVLPDNIQEPVPAVVFVHGSGSSNMDEKVMKLTPFKDLAEGLARHGIASVRYDKRSFAHGFKMLRKGNVPNIDSIMFVQPAVHRKNVARLWFVYCSDHGYKIMRVRGKGFA